MKIHPQKFNAFMLTSKTLAVVAGVLTLTVMSRSGLYADPDPNAAWQAQRAQTTSLMVNKHDTNHNGKIDADEAKEVARNRLLRWDTNKDGKLDRREIKAMQQAAAQGL